MDEAALALPLPVARSGLSEYSRQHATHAYRFASAVCTWCLVFWPMAGRVCWPTVHSLAGWGAAPSPPALAAALAAPLAASLPPPPPFRSPLHVGPGARLAVRHPGLVQLLAAQVLQDGLRHARVRLAAHQHLSTAPSPRQ